MLRIIQNTSAAGAGSYYSTADYYSEGHELVGVWQGEGARRLGLSGEIESHDWESLCHNRDPNTSAPLTQRQKDNRTVGYDFNFHVPKSVSLLYALTRDERIMEEFREAVRQTMDDIEAEMQTRVRKGNRNEDRTTGNMVWGEFVHLTSRPVEGVPDPHLHAHCFVFNSTWDDKEQAWKAGQFRDIKRDAPYFQAVFHSKLAERLADAGYGIERNAKGWEIAGVGKEVIGKFSRRTELIEKLAEEEGITSDAQKDKLGAKTREGKAKHLSPAELLAEWRSRLTPDESSTLSGVRERARPFERIRSERSARESMEHAVGHCFERKSVVPERVLLAEAINHAVGRNSVEEVKRQLAPSGVITATLEGRRMATTPKILDEEQRLVRYAREGRGAKRALGDGSHVFTREWLNKDQKNAVRHVLESKDRVIMIRGAAGAGKTSLMQEAVEAIRAGGREVFTFAPSTGASRGVLRQEGFENADTVARLLKDERLQEQIRGQVVWIDEAGLLGSKSMAEVFDLAERLDARVVLSGDRKQHASVERGSPLRLLEQEAGIVPANVREIQRQKGAYKEAVKALSEGRTGEGFDRIEALGWIREVPVMERYKQLAGDYLAALEAKETALVVSPTHIEKDRITGQIRESLKQNGRLTGEERSFNVLENANLTPAQRADAVNYGLGDVIQFHQNAKRGYKKGQRLVLQGACELPLDLAEHYGVYHCGTVRLAAGDMIRITSNGQTADRKHDLHNGDLYRVRGFSGEGDIVLANGWTIAKGFGHFDHGYCVTSHASQGKTVDRVLVGQSSDSFPASSREQFYVSASRARKSVTVYTDDRQALKQAVLRSDERLSATELLRDAEADTLHNLHTRHARELAAALAAVRGREARVLEEQTLER